MLAGVSGDVVAELGEDVGQFLVPRGRYGLEFYPTFVRLVGKTYEFKVRPARRCSSVCLRSCR